MASSCSIPRKSVHIDQIPAGTPIRACGRVYIADLPGGAAAVEWNGQHGVTAQSRLRRAAVRGTFAGVKRKRRKPKGLGVTARKGPRTGAIGVNMRIVNDRVDELLRAMTPCGDRGTKLQPTRSATLPATHVPDAATGALHRVGVFLMPKSLPPGNVGGGRLETRIDENGTIEQDIVVTPNRYACAPVPTWRSVFRDVVAHELAHAADPGIRARGRAAVRGERTYKPQSEDLFAYFNSPVEMTAQIAEVREQLRRGGAFPTWYDPRMILTDLSPKFVGMEPYLTPANRRRFLKMAARYKEDVEEAEAARLAMKWAGEDAALGRRVRRRRR